MLNVYVKGPIQGHMGCLAEQNEKATKFSCFCTFHFLICETRGLESVPSLLWNTLAHFLKISN